MSVFMCGCFIQNISLCAWSVLTLAQGTRSVDKNCLSRLPRHEKWIWTKKFRLTAQAKSWQAWGWWWVVGEWSGKAGDGRVEGEISQSESVLSEWAAWEDILFFNETSSKKERGKEIANYILKFTHSHINSQNRHGKRQEKWEEIYNEGWKKCERDE